MTELRIGVTVGCSACGKDVPVESLNEHFPDKGWVINASDIGYYGGFSDNIEYVLGEETLLWKVCHDCVVKLLQTFPLLAKTIGTGEHECTEELPCCNHAWKYNGNVLQLAQDGSWVDSDWNPK